jgi:FkbM family methyltransferase
MKRAGAYWVPDEETQQVAALEAGGWQLDHLDRALEFVTDWSIAVDGGAHVGSWTLAMAKRFGRVLAFEPAPDTALCLKANLIGIGNVWIHEKALGEAPGLAGMAEDTKYDGGNTGGRYLSGAGSVEIMTLDSLDLPWLGFLKLDVEGYEVFALRGAAETIARCRPVVMIEDKRRMAHRFQLKQGAAADFLTALGMVRVAVAGADHVFAWP